MTFLVTALAMALLTGLGLTVLRLAEGFLSETRPSPTERSSFENLALGFLCGVSVTGLIGQVFIALGMRLTRQWWGGWVAVVLVATVAWAILDHARIRCRWQRFRAKPLAILPESPMVWALLALTFVAVLWSFRLATGMPIVSWDALSFWYLKTRILLQEGTVFTPDFLAPDRIHAHTDYPILVNIVEAGICQARNLYREDPLKSFLAVWQAACLVIAGAAMTRRRGLLIACATTALIALLPALTDFDTTGSVSGYRDAPLALLILAAACLGFDGAKSPRQQRRDLTAFVLLLVLILGTKREGTVWTLFLGTSAVLAIHLRNGKRQETSKIHRPFSPDKASPSTVTSPRTSTASALLVFVALPFLLMLPWFLVRSQLPYPRSENFLEVMSTQSWDKTSLRAGIVLAEFRDELFLRVQKWGVLWWVFAALGLWRRRGWSAQERWLALLVPAGWLVAALGFIYTPWGDPRIHLAVSIDRLVLQGALLALWLTALNVTRPIPKVDSECPATTPQVPFTPWGGGPDRSNGASAGTATRVP